MTLRVVTVEMRLVGVDGDVVEMTEFAPWPERCGMWEAERYLEHDGARYEYAGCENHIYIYRELRPVAVGD